MIVTDKLSTESFHAFIDEQLTDEQYVQVEAQLDEIPEKIEEIQQCHIINERLREVFDPIVEEPVPEDLYELALYGLGGEYSDSDDMYDYEPGPYTELEEDIAAIDSLDIFPESEAENYLDDSEAADLELLSQTEHLSDFDIDNLRNDSSNIIPDIFDDADDDSMVEHEGAEDQPLIDPTDELLQSIDTLSFELEKAHQNKAAELTDVNEESFESEEMVEPSEALLNELHNEELELETLENEAVADEQSVEIQESLQLDEPVQEEEQNSAKEQVLETLAPEDELALEPLDEHYNDAFTQESEPLEEQDNSQLNLQPKKSSRPRNLRASQVRNETKAETVSDISPDYLTESAIPASEPEFELQNESGVNTEENLPEDLVAEFFAPNKGADFEVNEVVKQFEEVSVNFAEPHDDHVFDDSPFANIKYKALQFIDNVNAKVNEFKDSINSKKQAMIGKFNGGQSFTDFNKSPFDNFSSSRPSQSQVTTDTLDLGAFEEAARESSSPTKEFFSGDTAQQTQDDIFSSGKENAVTDLAPNSVASTLEETEQASRENIDVPHFENNHSNFEQEIPQTIAPAAQARKPAEMNFDMGFDLDDAESASDNLVNKFGDRLRFYKQKISDMRANTLEKEPADLGEDFSGFEKFKNSISDPFNKMQLNNNLKTGAVAVLAISLIIGVIVVAMTGGPSGKINNDRVEALAIDSHLVNAQFNSKIVADADSAIIEKLQWFSARVGRQIRLADIKVEDFEFKKVSVMPTMASFAATNIFENKSGQRITLMAIPDIEGEIDVPITCRIPSEVDGLCVWVKDSVRYVAVANLSLSRVRSFSEQIFENL